MPPDALAGAQRVLVMRLDNLGDVVLTSPVFRALREARPRAALTLLASPGGAQAAPLIPFIDEVMTVRAIWQDLGGRLRFDPHRELEVIDSLRARNFDVALVLTSFSQTPVAPGYAAYLAGVPVRIGQAADFGGSVLSHTVSPPPAGTHQADRNLHILEGMGVRVRDRNLSLQIPTNAQTNADALLDATGVGAAAQPIVVAPGASCAARRYDPTRHGLAAAQVARATGRPVVVVGTDGERAQAEAVIAACPGALSLAGQTSFAEFAGVIARAGIVLCGNSAALHLADAFGRPVVALYSGTDRESEWRPRRAPSRLLRVDTYCTPCRRFDCPYAMACLDIAPAAVVDAALELLADREETPVQPLMQPRSRTEERWIASVS
jgi:ADP-heptose:LPS heptosyltransferase